VLVSIFFVQTPMQRIVEIAHKDECEQSKCDILGNDLRFFRGKCHPFDRDQCSFDGHRGRQPLLHSQTYAQSEIKRHALSFQPGGAAEGADLGADKNPELHGKCEHG
jgi:hypothetical protein